MRRVDSYRASSPTKLALALILWCVLSMFASATRVFGQTQGNSAGSRSGAAPAGAPLAGAPSSAQDPAKTGNSTQEVGPTVRVRVNLVQVRVVVRDQHDRTVNDLKREDFLLYDQGKLQTISNFGAETASSRKESVAAATMATDQTETKVAVQDTEPKIGMPERFVALVYDDVHMTLAEAALIRGAAEKFLETMTPRDRVGVYSTSAQVQQDFTSDKDKLKKAMSGILPKTAANAGLADCPNVTYYMADLIQNKNDRQALQIAEKDALQCMHEPDPRRVEGIVRTMARQKLAAGNADNQMTYRHLEDVLAKLAGRPGDRVLIMVSPGFLITGHYVDETGIIDRANQANIVIDTLDARGQYTPETGEDLSRPTGSSIQTMGYDTSYRMAALSQSTDVLHDFASATGGIYFGNSNDLAGGIKLLGEAPETSYILAFSPQDQKPDGNFHSLKVALANDKNHYSIQARNGYYAQKTIKGAEERANQEIEEASLSQKEIGDLPLQLKLEYNKTSQGTTLNVATNIGMSDVHFKTVDGKKVDSLTLATVIFDENGAYVTGEKKAIDLNLSPENYEQVRKFGLPISLSFPARSGRYLVRQVVRDSEGEQMAARTGSIEIP
jgi:VWFA-related protein